MPSSSGPPWCAAVPVLRPAPIADGELPFAGAPRAGGLLAAPMQVEPMKAKLGSLLQLMQAGNSPARQSVDVARVRLPARGPARPSGHSSRCSSRSRPQRVVETFLLDTEKDATAMSLDQRYLQAVRETVNKFALQATHGFRIGGAAIPTPGGGPLGRAATPLQGGAAVSAHVRRAAPLLPARAAPHPRTPTRRRAGFQPTGSATASQVGRCGTPAPRKLCRASPRRPSQRRFPA